MKKIRIVVGIIVLSFIVTGCPVQIDQDPVIVVLSPDEDAIFYIYDTYQDVAILKAELADTVGLSVITIGVYDSDGEGVYFDRIWIDDDNPDTPKVKDYLAERTFQTEVPGRYEIKFTLTDLGSNQAIEAFFIEYRLAGGSGGGDGTDGPG